MYLKRGTETKGGYFGPSCLTAMLDTVGEGETGRHGWGTQVYPKGYTRLFLSLWTTLLNLKIEQIKDTSNVLAFVLSKFCKKFCNYVHD